MDEGDSAGEQQPVNLEVFTVSSTEYLKLGGKLLCNGQPHVFHDIKDTGRLAEELGVERTPLPPSLPPEIPALKKFAMDTALKHSMVATEKVIRDVARVLSQMVNYLNGQRMEGVLRASSQDLRRAFEALLLGSLQNGAERAKQLSEAIAKGWGSPVAGYPHVTYRAICNHRGVYTSPRYQSVDFNKELAQPILQVISVAWSEVFSSRLASSIEGFTAALLDQLSSFFRGLKKKLHQHRPVAEALRAIHAQQMEAARARLLNFTLDQTSFITRKQRTISRLLIPTIQAGMEPAYAACCQLSGPGYFRRMKEEMEKFIHLQRDAIFDSAVEKIWQQLELLQRGGPRPDQAARVPAAQGASLLLSLPAVHPLQLADCGPGAGHVHQDAVRAATEAGPEEQGDPSRCGQSAGVKPTSHSAALLGSRSPEGAFRPGSPPCPASSGPEPTRKDAGSLQASP
ncbi:GTPase SLIP-GC, partial [Ophiophagus hannah]